MFGIVARRFFLTCGTGDASTELNAFDAALLKAGIGDTNLVRMSSILPPDAELIEGYTFQKGSFVPLAYGAYTSSEPGTLISASVAVGIPQDPGEIGLIMEHAHAGDAAACEKRTREMVREGMEDIRGLRIKEIKSISVSHTVRISGAAFAAVVLCP